MTRTTSNSHHSSRRAHAKAAAPAQVHLPGRSEPSTSEAPFQPHALLAPAAEPTDPPAVAPEPAAEPTEAEMALTAELMRELGMEPAPCTPEAHALLKEAGISPRPAPGEPRGPDDERFSPIAIGHLTHRLLDVKRFLEQLTAEQKQLHETLRLAHLRGDLLHLLAPSSEGWCYQLGDGVLLTRRQGRKQWSYSALWAELEAQLKARQIYEQATREATWRHGAAFWDLRGMK
ncbi:MAG: hypothetical protein ACK55C_01385 [bacterium]